MQERRKQRETEFEQRQQEKEKERVEAARAKEKDHEERMAALNAMQQQHIEELQKKIQQKVRIIWIVIRLFHARYLLLLRNLIRNVHTSVCYTHFSQQQDESARRHKENIDQIKEKAFEMTVLKHSTEDQKDAPKLAPYSTKKFCTVCNVLVRHRVTSPLTDSKHRRKCPLWFSKSYNLNGPLHAICYGMLHEK